MMNEFFSDPSQRGGFDAMYYWDQFQPILAAIVILLLGWIIALIVAAGVKNYCKNLIPTIDYLLQQVERPILKI